MTGNERRYVTGLERQLDRAWRLYVIGWMCAAAGAAFFGVSVLGWLAICGVRSFL